MNGYKLATRFITRIVVGSVVAIVLGMKIDLWLHTTPLVMLMILAYVIVGSLVLLIKEITNGRKS